MSQQIVMNASGVGGTIFGAGVNPIPVPSTGLITVSSDDVPALLRMGCTYVNNRTGFTSVGAALAATAGRLVASAALSNGTLSIANQPDFPRQGALRVDPGTTAITAGNVAITYVANDGATQVDNLSAIAAASTPTTQNTSKGIMSLTSVIVTALAGGTSPKVQVNDTNALACLVDPGFVNFAVVRETDDAANATIGTVASSAACVTPTATPNGTHTYSFGYTFTASDS